MQSCRKCCAPAYMALIKQVTCSSEGIPEGVFNKRILEAITGLRLITNVLS